ncbi:hypothetical protein FB45DRAFT_922145 [Roridomyces roridus]|uniref:Alpha-ketoglutarate-dependent dioxygenase AlkB-like domain-containing protein n=1 Tax=Roridomyces roridus TaxID=1738132 RepID=A0AAD7BMV6_9AGAR|nr:hypothetical protein FB45DRAFT_922145 [Roridomyces roridus]
MVEAQKESSSSGVPAVLDVAAHLPKPPLKEYPPIWAQSRQEVCESFKWFRSYQGGVYQKDGSVKGYFLSAHSAQRDSFECGGKIIISHGGGKSENSYLIRPGVSVTRAAQDQQAQDLSVRALMETYQKSVPLVLLIDDKYEPFPFDLNSKDVYMTVLGFYRIIHAWAEYQPSRSNASGRVVRYKFAFQWCEDQGQPWWWTGPDEDTSAMDVSQEAPESSAAIDVDETAMIPTRITMSPPQPPSLYTNCTTCDKASPHVFTLGWVCLNPDCRSFWRYPNFHRMIPDQLEYNPAFLSLIDFRPLPPNYTLAPDPPVLAPKDGIVTAYEHSRGWHCLKCGRLSCRSAWEHYQCPNCQDTQKINGIIRPANTLTAIRIPTFDKFYDSQVEPNSGIQRLPQGLFQHLGSTLLGNYQTFVLPGGKGKIHLIKSNRLACDEADKIFEAYQQQASAGTLHFRRWPLRSHKLRGQCLTNYFSQNSGETYHYVGGADNTVPFHLAPAAVLQAHNLIEKRIFEALGKRHKFNEVLSAAYMEKQKMAFHSDSERGLGPVVAGLSMGSPALMHFRALAKYVPRTEQRTTLLTVVLRHGDVLMMEGAGVQDFYEHTVVPTNFRIAATARWIEPHHVVDEPLVNRRG